MTSLSKTMLIGYLGKDPEMRYMPDSTPTATTSLATTDTWKDKTTGEKKEKTEWHRLIFFKGLAEVAGKYLKKGAHLYIEGKNHTRKWTDEYGIERYITEVVVTELKMLGKKDAKAVTDMQETNGSGEDPAPANMQDGVGNIMDDDIPY